MNIQRTRRKMRAGMICYRCEGVIDHTDRYRYIFRDYYMCYRCYRERLDRLEALEKALEDI